MAIQLTDQLRENLFWLALNWDRKQLQNISPFNEGFYAAILSLLAGTANRAELDLVMEGTRGRVADGYAHMLVVEAERISNDPFTALRILGEISVELSVELSQIADSC